MSSGGVLTLVAVAGAFDVAGAVFATPKRDPVISLVGAFVVGAFLLAVDDAGGGEVATLFAAAYLITSVGLNGKFILDPINKITSTKQ